MEKKTFSTIPGRRAELETKLIEAVVLGDTETVERIVARLARAPKLRVVPTGREDEQQ